MGEPALRVQPVQSEPLGLRVLVSLEQRVLMALRELLVPLVLPAPKDRPGLPQLRVLPDRRELPAPLDRLAAPAPPAPLALLVLRVPLALLARLAAPVFRVRPVFKERPDPLVFRVSLDPLVLLVFRVLKVQPVLPAFRVFRALPVLRAYRAFKVPLALLGLRARLVLRDRREPKALPA